MTELAVLNRSGDPVNFPQKRMEDWRNALSNYAEQYGALYAVSDTETTGPQIVERNSGLLHRILEWSICFCYKDNEGYLQPCLDSEGGLIFIDEPINPFIGKGTGSAKQKRSVTSIDDEVIGVHGITMDYLFGVAEGAKSRPKLPGPAATFETVFMTVQSLLSFDAHRKGNIPVYLVFHNASFDIRFLIHECEMWDLSPIESYFGVIDTMDLAKKLIPSSEIGRGSLDAVYSFGQSKYPELIEPVERPVHSALIDSMILRQVYNVIYHHHKESSKI